jgi:GLPGLI family protein
VQTGAPAQTVVHEAPDGTLVSTAGDPQGFPMFKDHRTNQIVYRTRCYRKDWGNHCLVTDTLATIAWTIDPSAHKRFGPYDCQKATGAFRGRTYDVWFAPELPIPSGPFKLGGLPGLILEAQSQDGLVQFLFDGLELTPDAKTPIQQPEGYPTQLDFGQFNQSRYENTLESVRNFSLQQGGVPYKVFVPQGECIEYSNVKEK